MNSYSHSLAIGSTWLVWNCHLTFRQVRLVSHQDCRFQAFFSVFTSPGSTGESAPIKVIQAVLIRILQRWKLKWIKSKTMWIYAAERMAQSLCHLLWHWASLQLNKAPFDVQESLMFLCTMCGVLLLLEMFSWIPVQVLITMAIMCLLSFTCLISSLIS